ALGKVLGEHAAALPGPVAALRTIALTGLRREEVCGLRWAEIDRLGPCLRLERTKTGRSVRPVGSAVETQNRFSAFLSGLQEAGWAVGRNLRIDIRWGAGDVDRLRRYATELVSLAPDVILGQGSSTMRPLLQATRTVPIVFPVSSDPVGAGFVDSLARPG